MFNDLGDRIARTQIEQLQGQYGEIFLNISI